MNKVTNVLLVISMGLMVACTPTPQQDNAKKSTTSSKPMDENRSNPVKNTPARPAKEKKASETYLLPDIPANEVIATLPQGVSVPEGMVFIPGGTLEMGLEKGLPLEKPLQSRTVQGFFMDQHPVTVEQFRKFVKETNYRTEGEAFGDAGVFDLQSRTWNLVKGATWEYPLGSDAPPAPDDHPVTQVSWQDAVYYCEWAGKRLPTEAEWEHAARNGGKTKHIYSWGSEIESGGKYLANIWQGHFPIQNTNEDGYLFTSPVGVFGKSPLGLMDMSGNVWEWCQDWYLPYGSDIASFVPDKESERVMRGGSFLCEPGWCHGYRVSGRSGTTQETSLFHVGFRCAENLP